MIGSGVAMGISGGAAALPVEPEKASCCFRFWSRLPIPVGVGGAVIAGGFAIEAIVNHKLDRVALATTMFVIDLLLTGCYWRNLPVRALEQTVERFRAANTTLQDSIEALTEKNAELKTNVDALEAAVTVAQAQTKALHDEMGKQTTTLEEVTEKLQQTQASLDKLVPIYEQFKTLLSGVVDEVSQITTTNSTLQERVAQASKFLTAINSAKEGVEGGVTRFDGENAELVAALARFEELNAALQVTLSEVVKERDSYLEKIKVLTAQYGLMGDEVGELGKMEDQIDATIAGCNHILDRIDALTPPDAPSPPPDDSPV